MNLSLHLSHSVPLIFLSLPHFHLSLYLASLPHFILYFLFSESLLFALLERDLGQDLVCGELAHETHLACRTKHTRSVAADLTVRDTTR